VLLTFGPSYSALVEKIVLISKIQFTRTSISKNDSVCVYLKCSISPLKFEMKAAVESGQVPCSLSPSSGQTENRRPVPFWSVMFDTYLLFSFAQ